MVGAAQYLDEEIDWVLSAVVGKKKQSYIQTNFKDKFGRSLNHNQIRYIKNKYGKDPRFNSPLVNTRAPRIATSPKPGDLGEQEGEEEKGNEIDFRSLKEDRPSLNTRKRQDESKDEAVAMIRAKRKRGADDSGPGRSRFIKKIIGPQRPQLQRDRASKIVEHETPPQQWNTLDLQLSTSHVHSASTPPTSLGHGYHDTQYLHTEAHDSTQQPMLSQFHNISTSVGWAPSVPLTTWDAGDSPVFTSVNHIMNPSALTYPASTMEQLYCHPAEQTHTLPQTPTIQYQPQLVQPPSVSPFSPLIPSITPYPYHSYQEQQYHQPSQREQHLQFRLEAPENPDFTSLAISEVEGHPSLDTLSGVPSFQEMPIEPASSQGVAELSTLNLAAGDVDVHEHQ
ncbi:hypothetical protein T069G_03804 [Trichoderma breve]|uniref:Clr5 domain-containing protein n=1 Tax=Trichoderma breve TaxID=2034170 RepID=A0A9W9E9F2_9HYPO|nr:hypothetical protein T069G_03804 [Trichoderma breve]KAJ4862850.1 hypothetical protein T069G_03804 [Trichoderma breve]